MVDSWSVGVRRGRTDAGSRPAATHAAAPASAGLRAGRDPYLQLGRLYLGINAGYGFGKSDWGGSAIGTDTGNFDVKGGLFGGTVGANVQYDAFVFGVEGDFDASWMKGSISTCTPACETHNDWLATLRARAGYAADRVLFYATAGAAFGDIRANVDPTWTHQNKAGWTAGAGVEAAFTDNWTARVEYLFVDLQNANFSSSVIPATVKFDANIIRVGLMYKFR